MLEIVQADHQPDRIARPAHVLAVTVGKLPLKTRPVDGSGQTAQRVFEIEDLPEVGTEQVKLVCRRRFGLHQATPFCKKEKLFASFSGIIPPAQIIATPL